MDKTSIREKILAQRSSLSVQKAEALSALAVEKVLSMKDVASAQTIGAYISFGREVDTRALIDGLLGSGKKVFVPVVSRHELSFVAFTSFSEMEPNKLGFMEPRVKGAVDPAGIEIFIIPGIAFDRQGNRLGWGKGFYDRFFGKNPGGFKVGLAYDFQLLDKIPAESFDVKMDVVVTEKEILRFRKI